MRARGFFLFMLVSLALILSACNARVIHLPTPTPTDVTFFPSQLTPHPPAITPQAQVTEQRLLVLEWPQKVHEKDSDLIVLNIVVDKQGNITPTAEVTGHKTGGSQVNIPDLYATHNIFAVARLDMAGVEAYREEVRERMLPGQDVSFRWSIRANEPGVYRGVVWLRVDLTPKSGGATDEILLLARPIEVQAVTVLGISADLARILGGAGLLLSTVLGYPFIQRWVEEWLKRRKSPQAPKPQPPAAITEAKEVRQPD